MTPLISRKNVWKLLLLKCGGFFTYTGSAASERELKPGRCCCGLHGSAKFVSQEGFAFRGQQLNPFALLDRDEFYVPFLAFFWNSADNRVFNNRWILSVLGCWWRCGLEFEPSVVPDNESILEHDQLIMGQNFTNYKFFLIIKFDPKIYMIYHLFCKTLLCLRRIADKPWYASWK